MGPAPASGDPASRRGEGGVLAGTRLAPASALAGTRWVFVGAECSDGPLLIGEGFGETLEVVAEGADLRVVADRRLGDGCEETEVRRLERRLALVQFDDAGPPPPWRVVDRARVGAPGAACLAPAPAPEVELRFRDRGGAAALELWSFPSPLCEGHELRMRYAPAPPSPATPRALARRFLLAWNRFDWEGLGTLYAASGRHVDTVRGQTYLGRAAVREHFRAAAVGLPWAAFRLRRLVGNADEVVAEWEYMDPRLHAPLVGRLRVIAAAGEIFETRLSVETPGAGQRMSR